MCTCLNALVTVVISQILGKQMIGDVAFCHLFQLLKSKIWQKHSVTLLHHSQVVSH